MFNVKEIRLPPPKDRSSFWQKTRRSLAFNPEGLELVHPRYAIERRNRWMLERSDYVVTYVHHGWGGAAKFAALAERQGKRMIRL